MATVWRCIHGNEYSSKGVGTAHVIAINNNLYPGARRDYLTAVNVPDRNKTPGMPHYAQDDWRRTPQAQADFEAAQQRANEARANTSNTTPSTSNASSSSGSTNVGYSSTNKTKVYRDTRTQEQKNADFFNAYREAQGAAANGDSSKLRNLDKFFGITRPETEYSVSHNKKLMEGYFFDALKQAQNAAANGNPNELKNFDKFFGITRPSEEYTKQYYAPKPNPKPAPKPIPVSTETEPDEVDQVQPTESEDAAPERKGEVVEPSSEATNIEVKAGEELADSSENVDSDTESVAKEAAIRSNSNIKEDTPKGGGAPGEEQKEEVMASTTLQKRRKSDEARLKLIMQKRKTLELRSCKSL